MSTNHRLPTDETLANHLLEYTRSCLASRIGDRSPALAQATSNLQQTLTARLNYLARLPASAKNERLIRQLMQHCLQITRYPTILNVGTTTTAGTKFHVDVQVLIDVPKNQNPGSVVVYAVSVPLFERIVLAEREMVNNDAQPIRDSRWVLDEVQKLSYVISQSKKGPPQCAQDSAQAIAISASRPVRTAANDELGPNASPITVDPATGLFHGDLLNMKLNSVPFTPVLQPQGGSRKKISELNDRSAKQGYYLLAIAKLKNFGYIHAFSQPICIISNVSQSWQANAAIFWHDSCSLEQLGFSGVIKITERCVLSVGMPAHEEKQLSTTHLKHNLSWMFHQLVGRAEKSGFNLTNEPLPLETQEYLARKVLNQDCDHVDKASNQNYQCPCYAFGDSPIDTKPGCAFVAWSSFLKNLAAPFLNWCHFIRFLEEEALKVRKANESSQSGAMDTSDGNNQRGLWDSGLINILSKKQVSLIFWSVYADMSQRNDQAARPILFRISESVPKGISIYSVSDSGRVYALGPRTTEDLKALPLPQSIYENNDLARLGIHTIYPGMDFEILRPWCPAPNPQNPGYAKSRPQLDCSHFLNLLCDSRSDVPGLSPAYDNAYRTHESTSSFGEISSSRTYSTASETSAGPLSVPEQVFENWPQQVTHQQHPAQQHNAPSTATDANEIYDDMWALAAEMETIDATNMQ